MNLVTIKSNGQALFEVNDKTGFPAEAEYHQQAKTYHRLHTSQGSIPCPRRFRGKQKQRKIAMKNLQKCNGIFKLHFSPEKR